MIWAIIASEFDSTGRLEMHSFHGLVTGKICMADTTASAFEVLNRMALVTAGRGPRMRPSWLRRSFAAYSSEAHDIQTHAGTTRRFITTKRIQPVKKQSPCPEAFCANCMKEHEFL